MAPSIWQILIVILVVMLLFGAGRLPRAMEDLGKGLKSFKKGLNDEEETKTADNKSTGVIEVQPENVSTKDSAEDTKKDSEKAAS